MSHSLTDARYFSLGTFRKNGVMVATPVWFAQHAGAYYVFSAADAGKVKRLRNADAARVAPCDARGALRGDWLNATAQLLDHDAEILQALGALRRKYGWQMRMTDFFAKLSGRFDRRTYIKVEINEQGE